MDGLIIREAQESDLDGLQQLYLNLHEEKTLPKSSELFELWHELLTDESYHIFIGILCERIVSSCTLVVIKNLTRNMRPYALIENVVTAADCRKRGYGKALLNRASECAKADGCYKVMLLTGSKQESTLRFYEEAGFNKNDKTGFIKKF